MSKTWIVCIIFITTILCACELQVVAAVDSESLLKQCTKATELFDQLEVDHIATSILEKKSFQSNCNDTFSFVHVPKTGGTSVISALNSLLGDVGCVSWDMQQAFTTSRATPDTVGSLREKDLGIRQQHAPCSFINLKSYRPYFPFQGLQLLPAVREKVPHFRAVLGHVMHGSCFFLGRGCTYTTVLREPVARLISHIRWRCWRNKKSKQCDCSSVENFFQRIESGDSQHLFYGSDNLMVRMLSGVGFHAFNKMIPCRETNQTLCAFPRSGGITEAHTKRAITNLAQYYPVWGHMENLPVFFRRLRAAYFPTLLPESGLNSTATSPSHRNSIPVTAPPPLASRSTTLSTKHANSNPEANAKSPSAAAVSQSVRERMALHERHDVALFGWSACVLEALES